LGAAAFGTFVAWAAYEVFCVNYEGAVACLGRRAELTWHLVTALLGLGVAVTMLSAAMRDRGRLALVAMAVGLVLYGVSFLLQDAGIHGWHNLKVYPQL